LYEIRVEYAGNIYRVFCCFDEGALVILFNGFQKKTQKTPVSEIDKAERLMKEYFNNK
jgi:phage-related protein